LKKAIIALIIYVLTIHVVLPGLFYLYTGLIIPIYSSLLDIHSFVKAGIIISVSLIISVILLCFFKKDQPIKPIIKGAPVAVLFYGSVIFQLLIFYITGGFGAILAGEANGTLLKYISLFLNPYVLLLVLIFGQEKKIKILKAIVFYIIAITLSGSRSGILTVFFIFFIGLAFETLKFYEKKVIKFLKYTLILAPFLYVFATQIRNTNSTTDYSFLQYAIAGRMSTLETAMLPVYYYDNKLDLNLFYEKYSFINQLKLVVDGFIPGQIFDYDVMPNNYFRAIFTGYSIPFVQENYVSINITLPIYLYLKYNYWGILFTVFYIVGFYLILRFFKRSPLIVIVLLSGFYNILYFFDWVMVFNQFYVGLLTLLFIKLYLFFRKLFLQIIKLNANTSECNSTDL
jgi:hypothetical protein